MPSALLTGVGRRRGIAAGIAAGLAEDGWDLALSYWHPYDQRVGHGGGANDPDRLGEELRGQNRRIVLVPGDLEDPDVPAKVVNSAVKQLGGLQALVMSHAESVDSGILDTTVESFDRHYAVNVRATWLLIGAFARQLPSLGTPKDTANLVRFLLSKQGEWINGQLLYSNGGYPKGRLPV